ncbi:MAG TPA: hypothetical protein VN256_24435 [Pyrinomonadaceae bacterium]|nr:hypothetical protein [Pyrinomonadaceae bacterium]
MRHNPSPILRLVLLALCLCSAGPVAAQTQTPAPATSQARRGVTGYRVQVQLLVASNLVNIKTDYPASLESVVRQLKSSLPFKNHRLITTYIYNVADGSALDVRDVTYAEFEPGGGVAPTFLNLAVANIRLNADTDSLHISRFGFEARKRIFLHSLPGEGGANKSVSETVGMGFSTELNVTEGVPTVVGTPANALSDGVLAVVLTVNRSEAR